MTPCEERGYEAEQVFEYVGGIGCRSSKEGDILILKKDDASTSPWFVCIKGSRPVEEDYCANLEFVKRIYPPEEKSKDVEIVCEGKTTVISRESAEKLGLC